MSFHYFCSFIYLLQLVYLDNSIVYETILDCSYTKFVEHEKTVFMTRQSFHFTIACVEKEQVIIRYSILATAVR